VIPSRLAAEPVDTKILLSPTRAQQRGFLIHPIPQNRIKGSQGSLDTSTS
jgi:hypothetical protein